MSRCTYCGACSHCGERFWLTDTNAEGSIVRQIPTHNWPGPNHPCEGSNKQPKVTVEEDQPDGDIIMMPGMSRPLDATKWIAEQIGNGGVVGCVAIVAKDNGGFALTIFGVPNLGSLSQASVAFSYFIGKKLVDTNT